MLLVARAMRAVTRAVGAVSAVCAVVTVSRLVVGARLAHALRAKRSRRVRQAVCASLRASVALSAHHGCRRGGASRARRSSRLSAATAAASTATSAATSAATAAATAAAIVVAGARALVDGGVGIGVAHVSVLAVAASAVVRAVLNADVGVPPLGLGSAVDLALGARRDSSERAKFNSVGGGRTHRNDKRVLDHVLLF